MPDSITRARASALMLSLAALVAGPSPAAEGVTLIEDLTSTIMLLDLPCGRVVSSERHTDNGQIASCSTGDRYRVFVDAEGRVVAQKQ